MPSYTVAGATLALLSLVPRVLGDCESFGVDFTSGGTFFQNKNSSDPFTAIQEFTGCQDDTAHNVFIDPTGDQTECSETPMQPNDAPQLITCEDWPKERLYDGAWSLLVISNNGDKGEPIAYQRDFSLTVGEQQTSTVTPTVTVSNVEYKVMSTDATKLDEIVFTVGADAADTKQYLTMTGTGIAATPFTCAPSSTGGAAPFLITCDAGDVIVKDITKVALTVTAK